FAIGAAHAAYCERKRLGRILRFCHHRSSGASSDPVDIDSAKGAAGAARLMPAERPAHERTDSVQACISDAAGFRSGEVWEDEDRVGRARWLRDQPGLGEALQRQILAATKRTQSGCL